MFDIRMNYKSKKPPKIKFEGKTNDLLNELMEINVYVLSFILRHEGISLKEQMELIDNFSGTLHNVLYEKYSEEEIKANGTPR